MSIQPKIKIDDVPVLRQALHALYEKTPQTALAEWAVLLAVHIMDAAGYEWAEDGTARDGFCVNEAWRNGAARMHDVRKAGFRVHALARENSDPLHQVALRVAGQAVGTGHMRAHAMVASDYAVKAVNLMCPGDMQAVAAERRWQIDRLQDLSSG